MKRGSMSAIGTKRTSPTALHMSAFGVKRTLGPGAWLKRVPEGCGTAGLVSFC